MNVPRHAYDSGNRAAAFKNDAIVAAVACAKPRPPVL